MAEEHLWPGPSEPLRVADKFVRERYTREGAVTLVHHRGDFYQWHAGLWSTVPQSSIRAALYDTLRSAVYEHKKDGIVDWAPTTRKIGDVLDALRSAVYLRQDRDAPAWITRAEHRPAHEYIAMRNGLLHIFSGDIEPHTSALFNLIRVPFEYDPQAQARNWLTFLGTVWPHDPGTIAMVQQWFGYVLSGRTDLQKAMMIPGPPRSGKGTIVRVLIELLGGRKHVAAPTMADIGTHFGITPIIGKPLAVIGDARVGRGGERQVVERLLTITGEDNLTVDVKYKEAWTGKVNARFMILSNELPRFGDASGAIASRFLVARTTESFLGKEDKGLEQRLHAELPGIFNWALEGLAALDATGRFTESEGSKTERDALTALASPISMFLDEHFEPDTNGWVATDRLYGRWRSWCEIAGESAGSRAVFARDLVAAAPMQNYRLLAKKKGSRGAQKTGYSGIRELPTRITIGQIPDTPDTSSSEELSSQLPIPTTESVASSVAGHQSATEMAVEQQVSGVSGIESIVISLEDAPPSADPVSAIRRSPLQLIPTPQQPIVEPSSSRPLTAPRWINDHVAELVADGVEIVESVPVYTAGQAAGHGIDALRQAAKKCPLITPIGRRGNATLWRLGTGSGANEIVTAEAWLTEYLREAGGWVTAGTVYADAAAAKYTREAIKCASAAAQIQKRGQSVATQWRLDPNYDTKESA